MHKIKKYANRKLYDTTDKTYISLGRLSELIKAGEEVQIIDNTTGEEITASIISQLLARDKKEKTEQVPTTLLIDLLRKGGGTVADYAKKYASLWQNAMNMAEDEVDKLVKLLVKDKELSATDGSKLKKEIIGYADNMKQWISERVDRRVKEVLGVMKLPTREQVSDLAEKIEALSRKIEKLEKEKK
jgi:polyhydroxyalkanoate synthesis repressor PhaR